jgi:glycerol-3-phosphate dehydrogenase
MSDSDSATIPELAAFSQASRNDSLQRLSREEWDVLIIGGGINGAGLARDLALHNEIEKLGLKIALIDKAHFASGTSSKNSQLAHGGLRYLKYLNFSLVREALHERKTLMRIAPHLVRPQPFLLPFRNGFTSAYYSAGLRLYDVLAGESAIHPFHRITHDELEIVVPSLDRTGVHSAGVFYDCIMEAARLVLANIRDAVRRGATAVNYLRADRLLPDARGRVAAIAAKDLFSNRDLEIKAKVLVNAAGPWGDSLRNPESAGASALRLVRGSHLIFPKLFHQKLALSFFQDDGRIIFVIPWGADGELTLIGTTEALHGESPDRVHMSSQEEEYLISAVSRWLPEILHTKPVGRYSSLRPLIGGNSASLSSATRDARIWLDKNGMVNIAGGKYTTYRVTAGAAAKLVAKQLRIALRERELSATHALGSLAKSDHNETGMNRLVNDYHLDEKQLAFLSRLYGDKLDELLAISRASSGLKKIHPELPALYGQIAYAVQHEMAARLADFTSVSTYVRYYRRWTREEILPMAQFMGMQLGWNAQRVEQEVEAELQSVN